VKCLKQQIPVRVFHETALFRYFFPPTEPVSEHPPYQTHSLFPNHSILLNENHPLPSTTVFLGCIRLLAQGAFSSLPPILSPHPQKHPVFAICKKPRRATKKEVAPIGRQKMGRRSPAAPWRTIGG
jgi:hypothetical protein